MSGVEQQPVVAAVLGPTNTGKTHYAIERMLGLQMADRISLRLLARENYDRVVAKKGARVALITGEKIIPTSAGILSVQWNRCRSSRRKFLAIDEIQMVAIRNVSTLIAC